MTLVKMQAAPPAAPPPKPLSLDDMAARLAEQYRLLIAPGQVVELRALDVRRNGGRPHTEAGFFDSDHLADMAQAALQVSRCAKGRRLITGVNWSAGIINPFRTLGRIGTSLDYLLASQRIHANDPIALVVHAACPRVAYQDRGKSAVVIGTAAG